MSPKPRKLSHRYATEVDFEIYDMGPLSPLHGRRLFHSQSAPAQAQPSHVKIPVLSISLLITWFTPQCYAPCEPSRV